RDRSFGSGSCLRRAPRDPERLTEGKESAGLHVWHLRGAGDRHGLGGELLRLVELAAPRKELRSDGAPEDVGVEVVALGHAFARLARAQSLVVAALLVERLGQPAGGARTDAGRAQLLAH